MAEETRDEVQKRSIKECHDELYSDAQRELIEKYETGVRERIGQDRKEELTKEVQEDWKVQESEDPCPIESAERQRMTDSQYTSSPFFFSLPILLLLSPPQYIFINITNI